MAGEQLRGVRLVLLHDGREDVAGVDLGPLSALHVQRRSPEDVTKRRRLLRLALASAPRLFEGVVKVLNELVPQARQIDTARGENPLAFLIVHEREQQVLERQIDMAALYRLLVGDRQDDFQGSGEHNITIYQVRT